MSHKKIFELGEFSFYGRHALNSPIIRLSGKGKKGQDLFCEAVFAWLEYGHCPDFGERYENFKKTLEVRKNGFKKKVS